MLVMIYWSEQNVIYFAHSFLIAKKPEKVYYLILSLFSIKKSVEIAKKFFCYFLKAVLTS